MEWRAARRKRDRGGWVNSSEWERRTCFEQYIVWESQKMHLSSRMCFVGSLKCTCVHWQTARVGAAGAELSAVHESAEGLFHRHAVAKHTNTQPCAQVWDKPAGAAERRRTNTLKGEQKQHRRTKQWLTRLIVFSSYKCAQTTAYNKTELDVLMSANERRQSLCREPRWGNIPTVIVWPPNCRFNDVSQAEWSSL